MEIALMLLMLSIRTFIAEPFTTPSGSMYPTLNVGDYLVVSKAGYGNYGLFGVDIVNTKNYRTVERGDVIVFEFPKSPQLDYIKRVIGLPGDNIRYQDKQLFINDHQIPRTRVSNDKLSPGNKSAPTERHISKYIESIDDRSYEIALDNSIQKSRNVNLTVPANHYFVLGDNRDNSNDSRYWGFVSEANLVGKLVYTIPANPAEE